jgi:hypothetical protein
VLPLATGVRADRLRLVNPGEAHLIRVVQKAEWTQLVVCDDLATLLRCLVSKIFAQPRGVRASASCHFRELALLGGPTGGRLTIVNHGHMDPSGWYLPGCLLVRLPLPHGLRSLVVVCPLVPPGWLRRRHIQGVFPFLIHEGPEGVLCAMILGNVRSLIRRCRMPAFLAPSIAARNSEGHPPSLA